MSLFFTFAHKREKKESNNSKRKEIGAQKKEKRVGDRKII